MMKTENKNIAFLLLLLIYHLGFSFFSWQYITNNGGDAFRYWFVNEDLSGVSWLDFLKPGTDAVKFLTFPLVKYFGLPFWSGFIIFSLFSFLGFYRLAEILKSLAQDSMILKVISVVLLLLPNLHFWTSIIGKEPLIFVALVFAISELLKKKILSVKFFLLFLIIMIIRPHIAVVLLLSVVISAVFARDSTNHQKIILVVFSLCFAAISVLVLRSVTKTQTSLFNKIQRLYDAHISVLKHTDAYVPLDKYPFPYKLFTFYFRPLPFERKGLYYHLTSFENLIILFLVVAALYILIKKIKQLTLRFQYLLVIVFPLIMAGMYVYAYANFGLILRTKIMAMPFLYMFLLYVFQNLSKSSN